MREEAHGAATTMEKRKQAGAPFAMNTSHALSYPPETPPMIDPASMRYARLTPNLREMIQGFNQATPDAGGPMSDLLASPDPNAMYNSLHFGSPILRDFYPAPSPINTPHPSYDHPEAANERKERVAGAQAEMNALFNYQQSPNIELADKSDCAQEGGFISMMSSPEIKKNVMVDASGSGVSTSVQDVNDSKKCEKEESESKNPTSQTSSQTPPPNDTSSSSPSVSPQVATKKDPQKKSETREVSVTQKKPRKISKVEEKQKQRTVNGTSKEKSPGVAVSAGSSASGSGPTTSGIPTSGAQTTQPSQLHLHPAASAFAAANALAMNSAVAGLPPFACAMPPGMGAQMLPAAGTVHYQGRPMAIVPGARGAEMIPVELLAQATALQYGAAAQAVASRMMHPMAGANAMTPQRPLPSSFEPVGGSRKKRRRQMLERSGCSEEQARQNRAHALKRLRHKKTLRTQQNTVRYACRKRIAMVRPRVNGRFATKEEVEECERAKAETSE